MPEEPSGTTWPSGLTVGRNLIGFSPSFSSCSVLDRPRRSQESGRCAFACYPLARPFVAEAPGVEPGRSETENPKHYTDLHNDYGGFGFFETGRLGAGRER